MPPFTNGKKIAGILLGTRNSKYLANPAKFLTVYLLPVLFICFGIGYVYYKNRVSFAASNYSADIALAALILAFLLFLQLIKEKRRSKAAEKKSETNQFRFDRIYNAGIVGLLYTRLDGITF
jgi:hypothetical protein